MEEKQDFFAADEDSDATLVTPRFDDVEAETARPVVPFAEVQPDEDGVADAPVYAAHTDAPVYAVQVPKQRSWMLAVVIVSALVGTVLGGAGLRLYQQRQRAAAATVAAEPATPAQVETAQPSPAEQLVEERQTAVLPATATIIEDPGDAEEAPASTSRRDERDDDEKRDDSAKPRKSPEKEREAERKQKDDTDARDAERNRGKTPEARRVDVLTGPPRAVGTQVGQSGEAESEPRQIDRERDEIINERRQRRREQRERRARQRDVDRVRGIFEGQP